MGRNSKKNKGRKPVPAEQGLKEAASLATSSAVSSAPSRPARTAKHKVRKFPPQPATTTSTQATDSHTARGLKETQRVPAPNTGKQETTSSGPSTTRATENLHTSTAILTQSAVVIEKEVTLHQPTTANLSDSYDSSSASSSETEMGAQNAADRISNINNATEMLKIEQKAQKLNVLNQDKEKLEGLDADKYIATLPVAMESTLVPPRDDSSGHTPALVAGPNVTEPFASISPRLHSKIHIDEKNVTSEDNATPMGTLLLEVSDHKHEVLAGSGSCFETETLKQTAGDESSSDPARKDDFKLLNIERHVSERSSSGNETTLSETMVTSCTSPDNLKHEKAEKQELEIVKAPLDKGLQEDEDHVPAEKNDEPANFACEIESIESTPAHQVLPSAAEYNVVQSPLEMNDLQEDTNEETKQVNQHGIGKTPSYSVQEPTPKKVDEQPVGKNAQKPAVGTLQQQERNNSEIFSSLEGEAPHVQEQELYAEIKPEHEPEESQPVRLEDESTTSIHATMPASPADECKQDTQDSHSENLSTSVNAASEEETDKEKSSASQILERPEDVDVKSEVQRELPEVASASEKHNLRNSEQYILELVETEAKSTAIDTTSACQAKPKQIHIGSRYEEHITNPLENEAETIQVAEKQVEDVKDQDEQPDQLDRGTLFEGHSINSAREIEKLDVAELQVKNTLVNQEESQEEKPDLAHSDSICEEHKTKKPDEKEPHIACVNLDKDWECQEENPDQAYNDSVCKSEEATVDSKEEPEEKPSQLNEIEYCEEKKPKVEEPKFETAAFEEKGCQEEMPDHINQQEKEIEIEHVALHEEASQDCKQHQLDRGTACESHAANFTESEIDEVQVGDPRLRDVTLDKEDYQQETYDHGHGGSVCKELILTDTGSQENATDRLDVREPIVGNTMLHEDQKCKEDEPDQQLDRGIVGKPKPIESEMQKLEVTQTEVKGIPLDKYECLQENTNLARSDSVCEEDKTTETLKFTERNFDVGEPLGGGDKEQEDEQLGEINTLEEHASSLAEKLAKREPEPDLITLNKEEGQEEETEQAHSSYVHEESKTEDTQGNVDKHDSQVDGTLNIDQVNQEEFGVREPLVGDNQDQEGQEEKLDQQLDEGTACEERANSIVSEIEKLVEPDLISLNKEECQEEEIDQAHWSSVREESITEHTQENVDKLVSQVDLTLDIDQVHQEGKFNVGEPLVGDEQDQEGQVDQQLDEGTACEDHASSIASEIEKLVEPELITLSNKECQEEGTDQTHHSSSVHKERKTEDTQENVEELVSEVLDIDQVHQEEKFDMREPLVGGDKDQECQEEKLNQKLNEGTTYEEHANLIASEIEKHVEQEPEPDLITLNSEDCEKEETDQAHCSYVPEENKTEDTLENVDQLDSQVDVTLNIDHEHKEEKPDQVDSDTKCQEDTKSSANEIEKLEVEALEATRAIEAKECLENRYINSVEEDKDQPMTEVESIPVDEITESSEEIPKQVEIGNEGKVHDTPSTENQVEKPELQELEVEGVAVAVHKDKEFLEDKLDQLDRGTVCKEQAKPCVKSEREKAEIETPEVKLDKEEGQEEQQLESDVGSVCEEHQQISFLEDATEKHDVGDPPVGIMLATHIPDQVDSDSVYQEHPTSSTQKEIEKLEVGESKRSIAIKEGKGCQEEHATTKFMEQGMEKPKPEAESGTLEDSKEEMPDPTDSGYVFQDHETHLRKNDLEKAELEEPEIEGVKRDIQEDQLDSLTTGEEYAKTCVEGEMEKLEGEELKVALERKEPDEKKYDQADGDPLCEEHQQEHPVEKAQVDVMLDKDQDFPAGQVSNRETGIAIKEAKECLEEHTTNPVEKGTEQSKPEVESAAALEDKKEGPNEMPDQIESGDVCEEYEVQLLETELEKPEVQDTEIENVAIYKKDCQEDKPNQLETDAIKRLDVSRPELNSRAMDTEECEEQTHSQADDGPIYEDRQVADSPVRTLEKSDVREPHVEGVMLDKDHELQDVSDQINNDLESQKDPTSSVADELKKLELGESSRGTECQEEPTTKSVDNEVKQPETEEEIVTLKGYREEHTTKSIDTEVEQLETEEESAPLKEEEHATKSIDDEAEQPETEEESAALEDQIASSHVSEEYEMSQEHPTSFEERELEPLEVRQSQIAAAEKEEQKCQEEQSKNFEKEIVTLDEGKECPKEHTTKSADDEAKKPKEEEARTTLELEEQTTKSADNEMKQPETEEVSAALEESSDQIASSHVCEDSEENNMSPEHPTSSNVEHPETEEESAPHREEEHATKSVDNEPEQPETEEESAALEDQIASSHVSEMSQEHPTSSEERELELLEVGQSQIAAADKEEQECQEEHSINSEREILTLDSAALEDQIPSSHLSEMTQEHPTSSEERELELLEVGQSQIAAADKEEQESQEEHSINSEKEILTLDGGKECPEEHTNKSVDDEAEQPKAKEARATLEEEEQIAKSVDNEMKQPETEEKSAALEESSDKMPDQIASNHVCEDSEENNMSPEHPTSSKMEQPETEEESAPLREGEHAIKSVDDEAEQPETEEESAALEGQNANSHVSEEYEMSQEHPTSFEERELEPPEVRQAQIAAADKEEQECQEEHSINSEKEIVTHEEGKECPEEHTTKSADDEEEQPKAEEVREEEQTTKSVDNEMKQPETEEESAVLEESSDKMPHQIASSHVYEDSEENDRSPEHQTSSEVKELEALEEARQSQIAIAVKEEKECQEQHGVNSEENGVKMTVSEVESTTLEESPEQKPDQAEGSYICKEPEMQTVACELGNPVVEESEVEAVALHENKESQEDQLGQLESTVCEGHKDNPVENEAEKPQVNSTALDKEECKEEKADSGSICEEHQVADSSVKKPDVREPQVEVAILNNDQELPEEELEQVDNDSVHKDNTSYLESKPEVGKSEADMAHYEETEYHAENLCQLNEYDDHSTNSSENMKERKEKEPEVESAPIEESEECPEEISDQVESYSACNELETKCPEMEHPGREGVVLQQKIERKEGQAEVFHGIVTNSVEENLEERLKMGESQLGLALEEKKDCQPDHAENTSSVCEEQASKPGVRELNLVDLEEQEAADVTRDEREYQVGVSLHQKNENKDGGAEVSGYPPNDQLITDSLGKDSENLEVVEAQVDLALQQKEDCHANHTKSAHVEQAMTYVASAPKLELEEPEEGVPLDKVERQEVEQGEAHSSSICEEQKEKPEMEEQKVDSVELNDEKPADPKNLSLGQEQAAHSLESEIEKLEVADPEITIEDNKKQQEVHEQIRIAALEEKKECEENSNQVEKEPEPSDVVLDEITKCDEVKLDQITSSSESEQHPAISACEELDMGEQELESTALKEGKQCQENSEREAEAGGIMGDEIKDCDEDKPDQIDSHSECEKQQALSECEELEVGETQEESAALEEKKECQEQNSDQVEREPEARGVVGDEIRKCDEDKADKIDSRSECEQHPEISMEHEREKLAEEEPECPRKEECEDEDTEQLSSGFVCEEQATNTADTEKESLEEHNQEVASILVSNEECQKGNTEQYTTRSMNMDKFEVANSDEQQTTDFVGNETKESEVGVPPVEDLDQKECQSEKLDQIKSRTVSEEHATDLKEHDMDKIQVSQPELGSVIALVKKNECQEEIPDDADSRPARETKTTEEEVVTLEENEEYQIDTNRYLSETQKVEPEENETEKPKVGVPEVEADVLDTIECQSEDANQANSSSVCEDHETSSKEEDIMPFQVADSSFASEAYAADIEKNEAEKPEVEDNTVDKNEGQSDEPDKARGSSVSGDEEHASDSIEADMNKLEMKQPVVGLPPQVTNNRSVGEAQIAHSVEHEAEKPAVGGPAIEDDEQREKVYQPDQDAVCAGHVSDCKEDHTNEFEMPDLGVTSTTSMVEAYTLDSLKSETEETELGELGIEDKILDNKESTPGLDKSSSICEEREINFQKDEVSKLEINQPESDQDVTDSTAVDDAHMLDPNNETNKADEEAPEVEDNVPEQKESLGDKPYQDEFSSCEVHATNSKEDNVDEEVNLAEEEKPDQAINGSISVIETHTVDPLGDSDNETETPDVDMPEVADNVLGQTKCPDEKPGSGSAYEEHATDSKEDETIEPDKNQPQVGEADQMTTVSASVGELDSLMNEPEKLEEEVPEVEENMLEQNECLGEKLDQDGSSSVFEDHATNSKEDGINKPIDELPKSKDKVMEQKECSGEIPDPDDSSYVFVEHATHYQEDKLEVSQPEVGESDQVNASSTSESEPQTIDTLRNETNKPEEGVLEVGNSVDALKESRSTTPEQEESNTFCEEHAAQFNNGMSKLEVNQAEVEEPHQIVRSAPVSETHILDTHENKTETNEEGTLEVKNYVLKEKAGEIGDQGESSSIHEEQATDSKEDNMDKLEVNLPQPDQDNVLKAKDHLGKKPDHDESSSVCEQHAAGSTERAHRVEPEPTQLITPLSEETLNSVENEAEMPKVGVPEEEGDRLASSTFSTIQEVSPSSAEDYLKIKGEEQEEHVVDALSPKNKEDASNFLSISRDVPQVLIHDFSTEENVKERDLSEMPAEGEHDKEVEQAPRNSENQEASENNDSSLEEEHLPAMSQNKSEEIEFRQTTDKNNAPKSQEGTQEIPETQKCESINAAIPLEIISTAQEANNVNQTQDGQEVEAKEVTLPSQCQGISLPTLALAEVQEQESIPVDRGTELSARQPSPLDVKEPLSDMAYKDETREEHSPQSVLEEQESPAGDEKQYGIQEVAVMQYQVDNAEQSNDKDVETLDTDQTSTTEKQPGQEEACKDVAALMVHAEQPNVKVENQAASTECDKDTLHEQTKELALTQHDFYPERMKMVPEMSGESNQNVFEARDISEESETQTAASTDALTNEKITAAQVTDGDVGFEPKQNSDENSLHLQKIHTPILSGNEHKGLAGIDHIKGNFQVVEEISAPPEEQKHGFHLEEPAPIHIPQDGQEREVQKPKNLNEEAEDATDLELECNRRITLLSGGEVIKPEDRQEQLIDEAFEFLPTPIMTSSTPINVLPLPL